MDERTARVVLATHGPADMWGDADEDEWEDWRIECHCGDKFDRMEFAAHQVEQLAAALSAGE